MAFHPGWRTTVTPARRMWVYLATGIAGTAVGVWLVIVMTFVTVVWQRLSARRPAVPQA